MDAGPSARTLLRLQEALTSMNGNNRSHKILRFSRELFFTPADVPFLCFPRSMRLTCPIFGPHHSSDCLLLDGSCEISKSLRTPRRSTEKLFQVLISQYARELRSVSRTLDRYLSLAVVPGAQN